MVDSDAINYIKDIISNHKLSVACKFFYGNKDFVDFLQNRYPLLDGHSIMEKCYWIMNNIENFPLCKTCGSINTLFKGYNKGYSDYCSRKCTANSLDVKNKIANTSILRYGVSSAMLNKDIQQKQVNTMMRKYGIDYACKSPYFLKKSRDTCLEKYGTEHQMKCDSIKSKVKNTCLSKYNVECVMLSPIIKDKIRYTIIRKYGSYNNMYKIIKNKTHDTIIKKYGDYANYYSSWLERRNQTIVTRYGSLDLFRKKINQKRVNTCLRKFNSTSPFGDINIKNKVKNTLISRYGTSNISSIPSVREKYKNTCLSKYGVESASSDPQIQKKIRDSSRLKSTIDKRIKTNNLKFGVDYPIQRSDIRKLYHLKYYYDGKYFDSSYEVLYYQFLIENKISFIYKPDVSFSYFCNGIEHKYQPDFFVDNYYVEIKGKHFLKENGMINPFDHNFDELYNKKYECMINNNVIIMTEEDFNSKELLNNIEYIRTKLRKE